ncbi:hypothetical protein G195_009045 [Phytophthora kernoviae 00238/432]|uniref:GH16 domain-containing protein n=1 Tax=Phytophthora kernoviae 00238/432 TaxID=1284355 RepID=A0A8J4S9Y4_9STRA|nr:hypothetical protein G195_009045 [Phytophthora kernoviae 00238/432]
MSYRTVWASMKLPERKAMGLDLEWVHCTRPAEGGQFYRGGMVQSWNKFCMQGGMVEASNQRISACEADPGSGLNPYQGRGAPEIDIVEGGGTAISSSIQVGPGMLADFRVVTPKDENVLCIYSSSCKTPGANIPASLDINSDLGYMYPGDEDRWGINTNGTCFSTMNSYMGEFICSAGNPDPLCKPLKDAPTLPLGDSTFAFQMDALSANWPVHMAVYTDFVTYQVEWVPGPKGYVRWMLSDQPLYEIPAQTVTNPPQGKGDTNPRKIMIEEPLYIIFNVAMSSKWGAQPPNPKNPCRGDGMDPVANRICDSFPMYLKIDYIRVYQDLSNDSIMSVGCDPKTHPTRQWIIDHLEEYEDDNNQLVVVRGKAFCRSDSDCMDQRLRVALIVLYRKLWGETTPISVAHIVQDKPVNWAGGYESLRQMMEDSKNRMLMNGRGGNPTGSDTGGGPLLGRKIGGDDDRKRGFTSVTSSPADPSLEQFRGKKFKFKMGETTFRSHKL